MANPGKWLVALVLTMAILAFASSTALASETKTEGVTLASAVSGDTVTFTAATLKEGSTYVDSWAGATKVDTVLDANGYYVSTATFSAATLPAGTYPVSYHITMTAGTSDVTWTGEAVGTVITYGPDSGVPPRSGTSGAEI